MFSVFSQTEKNVSMSSTFTFKDAKISTHCYPQHATIGFHGFAVFRTVHFKFNESEHRKRWMIIIRGFKISLCPIVSDLIKTLRSFTFEKKKKSLRAKEI
ncbi:hypothetical protein AVEN_127267-1, partial [Araneus ventricosus]